MTLEDIIEHAKYGELEQLGVSKQLDSNSAAKVEEAERKVISYINLGLIELYKRFALRTEETTITLSENITVYTLSPSKVGVYLNALPGVFNSVLSVYDEEGEPLTLNKDGDTHGVHSVNYNTLQIPNPSTGATIFVIYSSAPDKLVWADDLATIDVPIPPVLMEALLHYIGYRGHGSVDGSIQAENNTHYMRFDASCGRVDLLGTLTIDSIDKHTLEDKGFV